MNSNHKIIHQIWLNSDRKPVPRICEELSSTWKISYPDYDYRLWGNEDVNELMNVFFPEISEKFSMVKHQIQKIDILKYLILIAYGGIYVDLDYESISKFDFPLDTYDCCLVQESVDPFVLGNALIAARKDSLFCKKLVSIIFENINSCENYDLMNEVLKTTGPGIVTDTLDFFKEKHLINIIPAKLASPINAGESREIFDMRIIKPEVKSKILDAFAVHYFFSLWLR